MRDFVEYKGQRFWLQTSGRYYQSGRPDDEEQLLHRRVWSDHNGPIPSGCVIHHIDEDWRNNEVTNLELRDATEHNRAHTTTRWDDPEYRQRTVVQLNEARKKANKWHGSPEGLAWHKEHGKKTWTNRETTDKTCAVCGATYYAMFPTRSRFCSKKCERAAAYKKHFTDKRTCEYCGDEFMAHRHRKTKCCSYKCSNRLRVEKA